MILLPSKKVLGLSIIIIALVAAVIIAFGRDKASKTINIASNLVVGEKVAVPENSNWQNELGILGLNSLTPKEDSASSTETTTDIVSRNLISNYLALKQNGTLDSTSAQKLIDQTVSLFDQLGDKVVLDTELNLIPDNGKQTITDYGENLGNILRNDKPKKVVDERQIITVAVSSRDQSKIDELNSVIAVYEKIGNDLIKMPVPKTFAKAHLDITNSVRVIAMALTEMKIVLDDPIKSLQAVQMYKEGITVFSQAMQATGAFIIKNNVIYKQGSGGYYLLYGI